MNVHPGDLLDLYFRLEEAYDALESVDSSTATTDEDHANAVDEVEMALMDVAMGVDQIAAAIERAELLAQAALGEAAIAKKRAMTLEGRAERWRERIVRQMQTMGETRIRGQQRTLSVVQNRARLWVPDFELDKLPDELVRTVTTRTARLDLLQKMKAKGELLPDVVQISPGTFRLTIR